MNNNFFDIDEKQYALYNQMNKLQESGCMFQYMDDVDFNGREVYVKKQKLLHFGSCSYMGLENHPKMIEASIQAVKKFGTQTPSSRAVLSSPLYQEADALIEQIFPGNHVMTQTVTLGHFSVLPLFVKSKDAIILDAYVHNSIRMTSQWCKANDTFIVLSKHNDIEYVEYLYKRLKKEGYDKVWYCADGVYSIHGDLANMQEIIQLLDKEKDFYAYIDDAHGAGWTGKGGCGYVLGNFPVHPKMIVAVSFAKSFATSGGALITADKKAADIIRKTGQTLLFSGPIQPATMGALVASLRLHLADEFEIWQTELVELIEYFTSKSQMLGLPLARSGKTPIQLLHIGDVEKTYRVLSLLFNRGFIAAAAAYPAVSLDDTGLRITLTRHLSRKDIDSFLTVLKEILDTVLV